MSIFTKPPMFPADTKPAIKTPRLYIEGKWQHISKHVKRLLADGWRQVTITGEPNFTFTIVELERETIC